MHNLESVLDNYNIIENGQNTEKSPGDLRRLVFTQAPIKADVKNSQEVPPPC